MEETRGTVDQDRGLPVGVLIGFLVCLVIVGFSRTESGRHLLAELRSRLSDVDVTSARERVPTTLRTSAVGGRNAISAGRGKVASAISRSPLPVSFDDQSRTNSGEK